MQRRIGLLFPGQGSQYVGMGKDLFDQYAEAKEVFLVADKVLGYSLSSIMFEGPESTLLETVYSQLAIYVHSMAVYKVLTARTQFVPSLVSGLSLGEYSALVASQRVSFEDGLRVIQKRAELMQNACQQAQGGMVAVLGLSVDLVEEALQQFQGGIWIANYNAPKQLVVAGYKDRIEESKSIFTEMKAKRVVPLKVSGAFHTPLMQEAQDALQPSLRQLKMSDSSIAFASNVVLKSLVDSEEIRESLIRQMTSPTLWYQNCLSMDQQVDIFLEIGPGKVLSSLGKSIGLSHGILSLNSPETIEQFLMGA